jgi:hypothetical protein
MEEKLFYTKGDIIVKDDKFFTCELADEEKALFVKTTCFTVNNLCRCFDEPFTMNALIKANVKESNTDKKGVTTTTPRYPVIASWPNCKPLTMYPQTFKKYIKLYNEFFKAELGMETDYSITTTTSTVANDPNVPSSYSVNPSTNPTRTHIPSPTKSLKDKLGIVVTKIKKNNGQGT